MGFDYAAILNKTFGAKTDGKTDRQSKPQNSNPRKGGREKKDDKPRRQKDKAQSKAGKRPAKPATKKESAPPAKSIKALELSIKSNPSEGGATYASRMDRGSKPGVAKFIIEKMSKATKDKGVEKTKLYDALVKEFGPGTEHNRRAEGLWITLSDYLYRNLKNRHDLDVRESKDGGLYLVKIKPAK